MALGETFKPGLLAIGLNYEKPSHRILEIEQKVLTRHIERKPIFLKPVLQNMKALLLFQESKMEACAMFEEIIKEYPDDLNILADLIYTYQKMERESYSDEYERELELRKDNPLLKARSILGQAHALIFDLADDNTLSLTSPLKDIWKQLSMKDRHSVLKNEANDSVVNTFNILKSIPEKLYERQIDSREIAIEYFEKGIEMLKSLGCSKEEILVWKHNLGVARASLDKWRKRREDSTDSRPENCIKALEALLDVTETFPEIEPLEEPLKKYVAKSCIFFAQFYLERKDWIKLANPPSRIKNQNLDSMWRKALSICPNDPGILQRCGRFQYDKRNFMEAIVLYNKSIQLNEEADLNWTTYAFRMEAYYKYVLQLKRVRSEENQINHFLELAYKDGEVCHQSKRRGFSTIRWAQICFQRAMPHNESFLTFHCQHIDFLYKAVDILREALNIPGTTEDGWIYTELGICYMYIEKFKKAVRSLQTSLELTKWSKKFPRVFRHLCECLMASYTREKDKNILIEFRFILKEAKKRDCDKWVTYAFDLMRQHNRKMLTDLLENMIEFDVRGCANLIDEALYKSYFDDQPESIRICREWGDIFERKLQERNDQESDINGPLEIQKSTSTENFRYDFFVSHSEEDKDWVICMLRPQLEETDDEINFKGCIPSRDFIPGELKIDSTFNGIEHSRKLLIVLTRSYLEDVWQKYYSDAMIASAIETKAKEKTIILIILEECEIPEKFRPFTQVLFTEKSDWKKLRTSLVMDMYSEMGERN